MIEHDPLALRRSSYDHGKLYTVSTLNGGFSNIHSSVCSSVGKCIVQIFSICLCYDEMLFPANLSSITILNRGFRFVEKR